MQYFAQSKSRANQYGVLWDQAKQEPADTLVKSQYCLSSIGAFSPQMKALFSW